MLLSFVDVCFADDNRRDYYAVVPDESRRCALLVASYRDERVSVGFVLRADASEVLNACARAAGLIRDVDVVEEISLHIAPAKSARSFATASLAVMMAAHGRLGASCRLGVLGGDVPHTIKAPAFPIPSGGEGLVYSLRWCWDQ